MTATLEQLVNVRSQLVEGALEYLGGLADQMDTLPWMHQGAAIKASDIAVESVVLTRRERPRPMPGGREGETWVGQGSPMDEVEAERYELPHHTEDRQEERWQQVVQREPRLALKGAPGGGKTFSTRYTLAAWAREMRARLERHEVPLEQVEWPIWVTAGELAQAGANKIGDALLQALQATFPGLRLAPAFCAWLQGTLDSPDTSRLFVVVDALDELLESDRVHFQAQAGQLDRLRGRVIVTCRTMHWEERRGWLRWGRMPTEVELAPFTPDEQRKFIRRFFGAAAPLAQRLEQVLQANFALRHTCTTPLLLTFVCLLHEEGLVNADTSYPILYAHMTRRLMSGVWRGVRPRWAGSTVQEERCLRFLEDIAWQLFSQAPDRNRFTWTDWDQAARNNPRPPMRRWEFLEGLEQVGLVVPAGVDGRGDRCWSVLHRTFLEFLAARALSRREPEVWLGEARKHFWYQPEWLEVLTFLAGLVEEATPLIAAVEEEQGRDDLFGSMLSLKARLVGAAGAVPLDVVRRVSDEVFSFWLGTLHGWRESLQAFIRPMWAALAWNANAMTRVLEALLALARDEDEDVRWRVAKALGRIGDPRALEALLALARDEDEDVRREAAEALGRIGDPRALEALLALARDEDRLVRREAAEALGRIGDPRALEALLALARDEDVLVRREAVEALGRIGDPRALEALLALARDEDVLVRWAAAEALGRIGDPRALEALLALARDEDRLVRARAVEALGRIGDPRALEALLALARDEDRLVRARAAEALGRIGDPRALEALLALARDEDEDWLVRREAAWALGRIGDPRALEALLALARDEDEDVRWAAAEALGRIGDPRALEALLALARDEDEDVRWAAAEALGRIGDPRALEALLALARDEDRLVRARAAEALGRIGDPRALEALLALARDEDEDWLVRREAAWALGRIGDPRALEALLALARDEDWGVRRAAVEALWRIAWKHRMPIRSPDA